MYEINCTTINITKSSDSQKVVVISGGAGFIGSHLTEKLISLGNYVVVIDNFITGNIKNLDSLLDHKHLVIFEHDITQEFTINHLDEVYHLASIASPPIYMKNSIETIRTNVIGTLNLLKLCEEKGAKFLLASTSEVYGDPDVHPQTEDYNGNVSITGPRACYDESKRLAETITYEYNKKKNVDIRVARIFNTYGPKMSPNDGRVISNFLCQALTNKPITVYGDGSQTRSFLYISDLIDGLLLLMGSSYIKPVNLGNPVEDEISRVAKLIKSLTRSQSKIIHVNRSADDPRRRKPNIELAKKVLNWNPNVSLNEGLLIQQAILKI